MATFNELAESLICPRCGAQSLMTIDLYFGRRNQIAYKLGDCCEWVPNKSVRNGGRPIEGNLNGEGYTECPSCGKDFFVLVEVRGDIFRGARPDPTKTPLVPD